MNHRGTLFLPACVWIIITECRVGRSTSACLRAGRWAVDGPASVADVCEVCTE